jgi:tetratricopeptide (TPR) repeat protein
MMDDSTHTELLVDYLDGVLNTEQKKRVEQELASNAAMRTELEGLKSARLAVLKKGVSEQVKSVHGQMMNEFRAPEIHRAPVRSIGRITLRIAASLFILIIGLAVFQYALINSKNLYQDKYTPFELRTSRGEPAHDSIEQAFHDKNWDKVIQLYNVGNGLNASSHFFAGQAFLVKQNLQAAIASFERSIDLNKSANSNLFLDDAEYYLALTYLKAGNIDKALPLFEKIHQDSDHLYHDKVDGWFIRKLRVLRWKQ